MTPSKAGDELLPFGDEERELEAFDDWGIEIDADGNVIPAAEEPQLPRLPRPEPAGDAPILQQEEFLPFDAEGDVPMSGGTYSMASDPPVFIQQIQQQQQEREREPEIEREEEEFAMEDEAVFTQASERARRRRRRAVVVPDDQTRVSRHELKSWSTNYLANSEQAIQRRRATTAAEARRNAFNLVFGRGIAGVGLPTGVTGLSHPLSVQFAHQGLQARLLGISIDQPDGQETRPRGRRRSALEALELDEEDAERRVRPRLSNGPDDQNQDQHHVQSDDAHLLLDDDEANLPPVEVGRRAGSSNHDILSDLPWNRGSSQLAPSSSVRGGSKPPSRRVSASPLHGRGSHINPIGSELEIERFSDQPAIFGSDDGGFAPLHSAQGFSSDPVLPPHEESQTTSQMMWRALDLEGRNFLGFIEDVARAKGYLLEDDNDDRQWVDFEHLFEPGDQQRETVAQAFYHVLSLATKNMIKVQQDGQNTNEAFGTIRLGVQLPEAGRAGEGMEGMPGHDDN
jgi:meiotic recombination protein REC8